MPRLVVTDDTGTMKELNSLFDLYRFDEVDIVQSSRVVKVEVKSPFNVRLFLEWLLESGEQFEYCRVVLVTFPDDALTPEAQAALDRLTAASRREDELRWDAEFRNVRGMPEFTTQVRKAKEEFHDARVSVQSFSGIEVTIGAKIKPPV